MFNDKKSLSFEQLIILIENYGLEKVCKELPKSQITDLSIYASYQDIKLLFDVLPLTQVTNLTVSCNNEKYIKLLCDVLPLTQISSLNIAGNKIGDQGIEIIVTVAN